MNARFEAPPRWAEFLLERLLTNADAPSVTGDLREEYAEVVLPRLGRLRADAWYLRQVLSLAPRGIGQRSRGRGVPLLTATSLFTSACGCWLALMEWLLRHPGYALRALQDLSIALVCFSTIVVVFLNLGMRVERWLWAGAIGLIAVAARALAHLAGSAHFEGFVLVISVALALKGVLMLVFLGRTGSPGLRTRPK